MAIRPGGEYAARPLHFYWLLDCSGSMSEGGKIEALNNAIREVLPVMKAAADGNPEAQFYVRVIRFSSGAFWHNTSATPLADFAWSDLNARGETDLGAALRLLTEELRSFQSDSRMLPPVLALVSDGQPTDDWREALEQLLGTAWGKRAVKLALAIGQDADLDVLKRFIDSPDREVVRADNAEQLVSWIKWVSTSVAAALPGKSSPPPIPAGDGWDESVW